MEWTKDNIIGKNICTSITYLNYLGEVENTVQNYGKVISANEETIDYEIANSNKVFSIPATYNNLEEANPDLVYMVDPDGKPVDIDLITTFTVIPENTGGTE